MEYLHKKPEGTYSQDSEFTQEELLQITPKHVARFLCKLVYGKDRPEPTDLPTAGRAATASGYKSAISYFMPNSQPWDVGTNRGNPTKSKEVNKLIKRVKKMETQGRGKESKADSPWEGGEYSCVVEMQTQFEGQKKRLVYPAITTYQCSMIGRIDDTTKWKTENIQIHPESEDAFMSRLPWSKNVSDSRQAPWQANFAANECKLDSLFHVANHLEKKYETQPGRESEFIFCDSDETPKQVKGRYSNDLREKIIKSDRFQEVQKSTPSGYLLSGRRKARKGSHSTRKYGRTKARRKGQVSKDTADHRGRWKGDASKASIRYESTTLPYPDALCAVALCHGGPIAYRIKPGSWVSNDWIVANVTPNVAAVHGTQLAALFGRALLWACCDEDARVMIPHKLYNRVMSAYRLGSASASQQQQDVSNEESEQTAATSIENPIVKRFIVVTERDDTAVIDVMDESYTSTTGGITTGAGGNMEQRMWRMEHAITANTDKIDNVDNNLKSYEANRKQDMASIKKCMTKINKLPLTPRRRIHTATDDDGEDTPAAEEDTPQHNMPAADASLSKTPHDLYELWDEYDVGIGGRKPAKNFTAQEKGRCKATYCRRKLFWDLIKRVINHSDTDYRTAIDQIYGVYGYLSITKLHKKVLADEKIGGHPRLYPVPEMANKRRKGRNS
jgi:hypothetical protein